MNKIMSIEEMKKFSKKVDREEERELVDIFNNKIDNYNFGVIKNYNETQKKFEVYIFVENGDEIVSPLLIKYFTNKFMTNLYYDKLINVINKENKDSVMEKISSMLV